MYARNANWKVIGGTQKILKQALEDTQQLQGALEVKWLWRVLESDFKELHTSQGECVSYGTNF